MSIKIDSETEARAAYIDYYTNDNTKVTEEDKNRIVQRYDKNTRNSWIDAFLTGNKDGIKYEFNDEEFEDIRLEGYEDTKDEYGENVNTKAETARNVGDGISTGVAAVGATAGVAIGTGAALTSGALGIGAGKGILGKLLGKIGKMGVTTLGKNPTTQKFVSTSGLVGYIVSGISCILSFVTGLLAKTNKANEEEVKAVNELYGEMETQGKNVEKQEKELVKIDKLITVASENAIEENEAANAKIDKVAGEHTAFEQEYLYLQAKIDRGEQLTPSEQLTYNTLVNDMKSSSGTIETLKTKSSEALQENKEEIGQYSSAFDTVTTNIANIKGVTDYASEIDEATQKSCTNQAKIQKINSIAGYTAAAGMAISTAVFATELGWINPVAWVVAAAGAVLAGLAITGAVFSGKAAKEQAQWAQDAGNEIVLRQETESANTNAQENLESGIDNYNVVKGDIETRTVLSPNDLLVPEGETTPETAVNPSANSGAKPDNEEDANNTKPKYL